jgi:hypothetical protein
MLGLGFSRNASHQYMDAKTRILDKHYAKDVVGCINPLLTKKVLSKKLKEAEGSKSPKKYHALSFIAAEREKGDPNVLDGKKYVDATLKAS